MDLRNHIRRVFKGCARTCDSRVLLSMATFVLLVRYKLPGAG
ncbi:hypothetical protein ABIB94_007373 [Bradyrhizobium sp. JR7.2]